MSRNVAAGKSKSETRVAYANDKVCSEMLEVCEMINRYGAFKCGNKQITFGELFKIYNLISGKLVGILLRARKRQLVSFDGECLFQGKDDATIIKLLMSIKDIRNVFRKNIEAIAENNNV